MFFNSYTLASPLSELPMPESSRFSNETWAAKLPLPHDVSYHFSKSSELYLSTSKSPYSAGFCEASPLPTLGYGSSSTPIGGRIPLDSEAQQRMGSFSFDAAELSREMVRFSYVGNRR